jgi:hypothetical protein
MSLSLKTFWSLLAVALSHRWLADIYLRSTSVTTSLDVLKESIAGILSDIWVSGILATPVLFAQIILGNTFKGRLSAQRFAVIWLVTWTALSAGHQVYVEFFRHMIIPFHLSYLVDVSFLKSNGRSFFSLKPLIICLFGGLGVLWIYFWKQPLKLSSKLCIWRQCSTFFVVLLVSLASHAINIRYRVNWFVPENLQTHFLEHLYAGFNSKKSPRKLDPNELDHLKQTLLKIL